MLEVKTDAKTVRALSELTNLPEWDYFIAYLSQIRESEREKLEREDTKPDETISIRGGLKRLRKILELRESVRTENNKAATA